MLLSIDELEKRLTMILNFRSKPFQFIYINSFTSKWQDFTFTDEVDFNSLLTSDYIFRYKLVPRETYLIMSDSVNHGLYLLAERPNYNQALLFRNEQFGRSGGDLRIYKAIEVLPNEP